MSKILGVRLDELNFSGVIAKVRYFLVENKFHMIATVNPEFIMTTKADKNFMKILNQSDLNIPDGVGLQYISKFLGQKIGERVTGVDLTMELAKLAEEKGYSIFFLGADEGVAETTATRLKFLYSKLKVAGVYAGTPNEAGLIEKINATKPDILLVAYGAPKQEKFIYDNKDKLKVRLAMGVGGTFDYIAEVVPYAPACYRKFGFEWFYRLMTQPKRFKRIFTAVVKFPLAVLWSKMTSK